MTPGSGRQAGFTLVEVLLALLIAAMVMIGTYSVTAQVMGLSEDVQAGLAAEDALDILGLTLGNDLTSTLWADTQKTDVAEAMAFYGGQDATALDTSSDRLLLSLATAATLDPGAPFPSHAFNRVEYVLRQAPENDRDKKTARQLVRREIPVGTLVWRDGERRAVLETVLIEALEQGSLRFSENAATTAQTAWDSRTRQAARLSPLPAQVRLTGTATFSGKRRTVDVITPLPPQTLSPGVLP
jgi:general secretion pathway protein J